MSKSLYPYHGNEPVERRDVRYMVVASIAFCMFYYYTVSGLRSRYILWHLNKRRYGSGFYPLETAAVAMYHSVVLCILSETIVPFVDLQRPFLLTPSWLENLGFRMKNIFFLSIIQHTALELSGFFDKIRRDYFQVERQ